MLKNFNHIMMSDNDSRPSAQEVFDTMGGNKYENILILAARARQIQNQRNFQQKHSKTRIKHDHHVVTAVLHEVLDNKLSREGVIKHG